MPVSKAHTAKLSKKDKEMVKLYVSDPKITKTEAWKRTHNTSTQAAQSQYVQAYQAFSNPLVKMELAKANDRVEQVLMNTVDQYGDSDKGWQRGLAVDTAKYIHDKIHGKATQKIEQRSEKVVISIDLSSTSDSTD